MQAFLLGIVNRTQLQLVVSTLRLHVLRNFLFLLENDTFLLVTGLLWSCLDWLQLNLLPNRRLLCADFVHGLRLILPRQVLLLDLIFQGLFDLFMPHIVLLPVLRLDDKFVEAVFSEEFDEFVEWHGPLAATKLLNLLVDVLLLKHTLVLGKDPLNQLHLYGQLFLCQRVLGAALLNHYF